MPWAHRVAQPLEELHEGEIQVEGAGDGAAQQAGHVAPEGQQRHRDHQGHDARQDQPFDGVEPDRAHGIDFQVDLHGADLGREGAARTSRHDDGGEQDAQFAEHADADGFHREGLGAELPELLDALVGDHNADQEAQHAHDHQRPDPDLVHLADHGADPEAARLHARLDENKEDLAEEFAEIDALVVEIDRVAPDFLEPMGKPVDMLLGRRLAHVVLHDIENVGMSLLGSLDLGVRAAGEFQDFQRTRRVELLDSARIDDTRGFGCPRRLPRLVGLCAEATQAEYCPHAADLEDGFSRVHRVANGWFGVGHWRD